MPTGLVYHITRNLSFGIERIAVSRDGGRQIALALPPGCLIPEAGLDAVSPFGRAAEVILAHYLRTTTRTGIAAAETQASEQRTLLSRLLSARLRDETTATITATDIERKLFPGFCAGGAKTKPMRARNLVFVRQHKNQVQTHCHRPGQLR